MRASGVLMHITSLPGPYGVGTMGKTAYEFVDFLKKAGQSVWQILPEFSCKNHILLIFRAGGCKIMVCQYVQRGCPHGAEIYRHSCQKPACLSGIGETCKRVQTVRRDHSLLFQTSQLASYSHRGIDERG